MSAPAAQDAPPHGAPQTEARGSLRALFHQGDQQQLRAAAEHYVTQWPNCPTGWTILAKARERDRDWNAAATAAQQLCARDPQSAWHWSYLGLLLKRAGRLAEAEQALREALERAPEEPETLNLLGIVQIMQGQPGAAETTLRQALKSAPELAEAWNNLGTALRDLDRLDESMLAFRQAVALAPDNGRARSNLLFSQAFTAALTPERQRQEAQLWEREVLTPNERAEARQRQFSHRPRRDQRLRLGLLSAEFGHHPVGHFLLSWLRALDRERFVIYCYPSHERQEPESQRFRDLADVWSPIDNLSDAQAAERMRADGIDVLIETSGHTENNRLGVIARRAAPVQCHYIGYFATTGLTEMDYFIGDPVLIPPEHDSHFTEQVWRLPRTRYAYEPLQQAPEPRWQPDRHGQLRLGSFNNLTKVRHESLVLWSQVLRALPQARLILKDKRALDHSVQARILGPLREQGIHPDRVEFRGASAAWSDHMDAYNDTDIALDSLPFNSATTGFDALWMGTPLITLTGDRLAGRQAASLLSGLGRTEWIARDADEFVAIVTGLAQDPARGQRLREIQRAQMRQSELCDGEGLARALERSIEEMLELRPWRMEVAARRRSE
ncbi:O-linked N-acetylglucosamine transferase, SPINDLY family protein [Thiorhodovibrio frisius]|nr:tetratricopeptide repeat protein [Thiorhodovibrio frisius]